ncbi:hypothetical protein [Neosynechococcus sphagnicola]|nr:hypothetical protein [Neosynechococcus sphagnicola]
MALENGWIGGAKGTAVMSWMETVEREYSPVLGNTGSVVEHFPAP